MKLAWHPSNSNILASGSRDHLVKVWDVTDMVSPLKSVTSVDPVDRLKWIPSRQGATSLIGVATLLGDSALTIWNIREPHIPKYSFKKDSKNKITDVCFLPEIAIYTTKTNSIIVDGFSNAMNLMEERRGHPLCCDILENYAFTFDNDSSQSSSSPLPSSTLSSQKFNIDSEKPNKKIHFLNAHSLNSCYNQEVHFHSIEEELLFFVEQYKVSKDSPLQAIKYNSDLCQSVGKTELSKIWDSVYQLLNDEEQLIYERKSSVPTQISLDKDKGGGPISPDPLPTKTSGSSSYSGKTENLIRILRYYKKRPDRFMTDLKCERILIPAREPSGTNSDPKILLLEEYEKELLLEINTSNINLGLEEELSAEHKSQAVVEVITELIDNGEFIHGYQLYLCLSSMIQGLDTATIRLWTWTYIELLNTMGFYNKATNMMKHSDMEQLFEGMQRKLNPIQMKCASCKSELETYRSGVCGKCLKHPSCAICQKKVTGLNLWCQICGHGGHYSDMKAWFSHKDATCASGCGHSCFRFYKADSS